MSSSSLEYNVVSERQMNDCPDFGQRKWCTQIFCSLRFDQGFRNAKDLHEGMRNQRLLKCQKLLERYEVEQEFLNREVKRDETWICEYDPDTERESTAEWHT